MLNRADELRELIASKDRLIAIEEEQYRDREQRMASYRAYIDQLHAQRKTLETQLERETAGQQKAQGHCVTLADSNGVEWKV